MGQQHEKAHLAVTHGQNKDEEPHRDDEPKEKIQKTTQQGDRQTHPEDTEEVVQHPHRHPHHQRPQQRQCLVCN